MEVASEENVKVSSPVSGYFTVWSVVFITRESSPMVTTGCLLKTNSVYFPFASVMRTWVLSAAVAWHNGRSAVTDIHFTLSVDHAAKIKINMADYSNLNVVDGENALTIPSNKLPISISAAKWGDSFYEVLLDGQNIAYKYGYAVTPHEGSVIKVTTDFPDKDCKLTLVLPDGIKKFFTAVVVDDNLITDFSKDIVLKAGTKAKLYYNPSFWSSDPEQAVSVTVNGEKTSWFGPGYSIVMRDNTIVKVVQAIAVPTIHVKVKINKDNAATIYRSSETYYDTVTLKANDEQEVELPDDDGNKIMVKTVSDEETIKGINLNDEPVSLDGNNYAEIGDLVDGDHISIFMKNSTTGIDAVKATTAKKEVYNLLGQKVGNCRHAKGIFIMNGKKVVLK